MKWWKISHLPLLPLLVVEVALILMLLLLLSPPKIIIIYAFSSSHHQWKTTTTTTTSSHRSSNTLLLQLQKLAACSDESPMLPPNKTNTNRNNNRIIITDDEAMKAMERLEEMDGKFGVGVGGASTERSKLTAIVTQWEQQQQQQQQAQAEEQQEGKELDYYDDNDDECSVVEEEEDDNGNCEDDDDNDDDNDDDTTTTCSYWDDAKFVAKHLPNERVAIFGGDPKRRRQLVEKKLQPYKTLDQFGTPHDVGISDTNKLLSKIQSGKLDVVYMWTRFNCHGSRASIRDACLNTGTRFFEVESLAYIR